MNKDWPKYLYHYTSIEALALILESNKIRFNRLDAVDDLSENLNQDNLNLGRNLFISCWTDSPMENIPLWNMYTSLFGVRVKLPTDMFKICKTDEINGCTINSYCCSLYTKLENNVYSFVAPRFIGSDFLRKIKYTNDENKLRPKVLLPEAEYESIKLNDILCKYKSEEWKFQNEWRFAVQFITHDGTWDIPRASIKELSSHQYIEMLYLFLDLKDDIFDELEVTLAPKATNGHIVIVKSLLEKFAPKANLKLSCLFRKIR